MGVVNDVTIAHFASYLQTEFLKPFQSLSVAFRIIHGIVGVGGDPILFPLRRFRRVLDHAGIEIADAAAGKSKRVASKKPVEVVIDELPIERNVVRYKYRPTFGVLSQPVAESFHHGFRIIESHVLVPREAAHRQSIRNESV